jgi:galactose mutarotase-like enzyme
MHSQMLTSRLGAELISYKLDGIEKIHQGQDCIDENGRVYWKRHFPVLFPIVGKLKQNKTIINGRTYEMGQHGFARDMEFEPVTKLDNFHSYVLKSNPSTFVKYPFDFSLYVTYRTDENKLTTMYKVVNEGDNNMTFGIGGHPAFKIDQRDLYSDEYYLEFEEDENKIHFLYLVDGLIGTEYARNIMQDLRRIPINQDSFKNDAIIMKGLTSHRVSLKKKTGNKTLLTMDFEGFPYLAVWSKPGAPFICLEPWYTTADAIKSTGVFTQKTDMLTLAPRKEFECIYC